ncbi:hypothetical protein PG996_011908 [Apiospora saccharicola]|uniref:Uncharacterized protein n=1 Tax=Apiospora saccharicola TaxID=335842 RepID=A0ABR1UGC8_9PEZI
MDPRLLRTNPQRPERPNEPVGLSVTAGLYPEAEEPMWDDPRDQFETHLPDPALPRGLREPHTDLWEATAAKVGNVRHDKTATYLNESRTQGRRR